VNFTLVYNCSILAGVALVAAGVALLYGFAWALIVSGALVLALTIYAGHLATRGKG
jgi:hypothetical protein